MAYEKADFLQAATSTTDPTPSGTALNASVQTATFYSAPIYIGDSYGFKLRVSCSATGSPSGTWTVEFSDDVPTGSSGREFPDASMTNWDTAAVWDITTGLITTSKTVSNATVWAVESDTKSRWFRLKYTESSGDITITAKMQKKGIRS